MEFEERLVWFVDKQKSSSRNKIASNNSFVCFFSVWVCICVLTLFLTRTNTFNNRMPTLMRLHKKPSKKTIHYDWLVGRNFFTLSLNVVPRRCWFARQLQIVRSGNTTLVKSTSETSKIRCLHRETKVGGTRGREKMGKPAPSNLPCIFFYPKGCLFSRGRKATLCSLRQYTKDSLGRPCDPGRTASSTCQTATTRCSTPTRIRLAILKRRFALLSYSFSSMLCLFFVIIIPFSCFVVVFL